MSLRVFVAGHQGMVGSSIVRQLRDIDGIDIITRQRNELDLTDQTSVFKFFNRERIDQVYLAAAKVGGINANNKYPAEFIYQNLMIAANVTEAAFRGGVRKLLFLGSSCVYPKYAAQPMTEEALLTGMLEPTNEPYAIAKIAGIKLCESYNRQYGESYGVDYRSVMPCNLYGPADNYHLTESHVIPALIRKCHDAKIAKTKMLKVWGTGKPRREFLYVDDLARACVLFMNIDRKKLNAVTAPMCSHINVGSGFDISIYDLVKLIKNIVGYEGDVKFDSSMPDGSPRKLTDNQRALALGWKPEISLEDGLRNAYSDFIMFK